MVSFLALSHKTNQEYWFVFLFYDIRRLLPDYDYD